LGIKIQGYDSRKLVSADRAAIEARPIIRRCASHLPIRRLAAMRFDRLGGWGDAMRIGG